MSAADSLFMTAHLELLKLFSFGHNVEDVGLRLLRVKVLIERLHMRRIKENTWLMIFNHEETLKLLG